MKKAIATGKVLPLPSNVKNVRDFFNNTATNFPDKGLWYIAADGSEVFISYKDQLSKAKKCLFTMQKLGVQPGDKLIILVDYPPKFYTAFWMCMLARFVAIPVGEPASYEVGSQGILRFQKIWENHPNDYVLISSDQKREFEKLSETKIFKNIKFIVYEELLCETESNLMPEIDQNEIAFIQYSSGSTGKPKGILLNNKNIIESCWATKDAVGISSLETVFSWLPHSHNMGIFAPHMIGIITGCNVFTMKPSTFISDPFLFLKKISEHRGSWFVSSNFGFDWLEKNINEEQIKELDLSSLTKINNGADPISISVIEAFTKKFAPCGYKNKVMRPAYGLSETTLAVTMARSGRKEYFQDSISRELLVSKRIAEPQYDSKDSLSIVSVGEPVGNVKVRVVDEDNNLLNEREVGEIQIAGPLISSGYFANDHVESITNEEGFFSTGDLGYLVGNELMITGRKKDVIIIRGKNYIANDIEQVICDGGVLSQGNVAVTSALTEDKNEVFLVFVQFKDELKKFVFIQEYVKKQVSSELGIQVDYVLPSDTFPRTSTGKVQRFLLRQRFEQGNFQLVQTELEQLNNDEVQQAYETVNSLELKIRKIWSDVLKLEEGMISKKATFRSLGGDSVKAYLLLQRFSEITGQDVGPKILLKCETIEATASFLKENYMDTKSTTEQLTIKQEEPINENSENEIVITGLSLRFPDAENKDAFWTNLVNGKNSVKRVSHYRKQLVDDESWNNWLGEIEGVDEFDYDFFRITKNEANCMDPQHRILLELAYQALEEAGEITEELEEKRIATYAAVSSNFFPFVLHYANKHGVEKLSEKTLVRNLNNVIAAAISHEFNFVGPALAIDTACSSTLVAIHEAAEKIRTGKIDGAVVATSNVIFSKSIHDLADLGGILSSNGQSRVFDKDADGSALGEGAMVVYLERKKDAVKNRKHIYGLIKGSAVNNDGYSLSIMAPNPKGQYQVLSEAYKNAGVSPYDLGMYEAHGTGTEIGDPIEISALSKLFKEYQSSNTGRIGIGSAKTNIGHLLPSAAGASLAKVLLCLQHKQLVPSLHLEELNPKLLLHETPFEVISKVQEWKNSNGKNRCAGINSLGLGGTNAHMVIEEWIDTEIEVPHQDYYVMTVSAKTKESLQVQKKALLQFMQENPEKIPNIAYTRNCCRVHYSKRAACIVTKSGEIIENFKDGTAIKLSDPKISFLWDSIAENLTWEKMEQLLTVKNSLGNMGEVISVRDSMLLKSLNISKKTIEEINDYKTDILVTLDGKTNESKNYHTLISLNKYQHILTNLLKDLYLLGASIDWKELYKQDNYKIIQVPHYEFAKEKVWIGQEE